MKRKHFFNINADTWDNHINPYKEKRITGLMMLLQLKETDSIIDIGSGTGILVPYLRKLIKNDSNITELDFSKCMIDKAKEKFGNKINYIVSSVEKLNIKDNSFSKAVIFNSFPHFEDKQKALFEVFRILKNNAIILLAHSDSKNVVNNRHKEIGGVIANDVFQSNDNMICMFKKAGFKKIEITDNNDVFYIKAIKQEE
ncbi:MAG: class I SAM-dependent methyltransferase [Endomicrobiaceae bacterium]